MIPLKQRLARWLHHRLVVSLIEPATSGKIEAVWHFSDGSGRAHLTFPSRGAYRRHRLMMAIIRTRLGVWALDRLCKAAGYPTFTELQDRIPEMKP